MNVEHFKEEFTNILRRFTAPNIDINILPIIVPLTNQDIIEAVNDVINSELNVTLVHSMQSDVKTPATGIIVTTPDAPDIPKLNVDHPENGGIPGRFRSLDTLKSNSLTDSLNEQSIIPESSPLTTKIENNINGLEVNIPDAHNDEKKVISKTSPSTSTLVRSDTFTREEEFKSASNDDVFSESNSPFVKINEVGNRELSFSDSVVFELIKKLEPLKSSVHHMLQQIEDIEKVVPENARPIRRLSTIGYFPCTNRGTIGPRTIQRPKMARRSMTTFPGTPTSSRMSPGAEKIESTGRKSMSLVTIGGSKLSIPSTCRSVSSGALILPKKSPIRSYASPSNVTRISTVKSSKTSLNKTSPSLSLLSALNQNEIKPPKNPKYAHVQSTIPKHAGVLLGKRKANQF